MTATIAPRHEYHLVIDRNGLIRADTFPQSFDAVVRDIRDGQYEDIETVLYVKIPSRHWPHEKCIEDVTLRVANALLAESHVHPLTPDTAAYRLVEEKCSCRAAWTAREVA